jgi:hypothetical protein
MAISGGLAKMGLVLVLNLLPQYRLLAQINNSPDRFMELESHTGEGDRS